MLRGDEEHNPTTPRALTLRAGAGHAGWSTGAAGAALLVLTLLLSVVARSESPHSKPGPAPRRGDLRFENSAGSLPRAGPGVTLPFFFRRATSAFRTPQGLPPRAAPEPEFLKVNARVMVPSLTWIGHATLLVQLGGITLLTDPVWSDRAGPTRFTGARRYVPPGIAIEDLPPIDLVLISHNHYDHLDTSSLRRIHERNPDAIFAVPMGNAALLRRLGIEQVVELDWGQHLILKGATIHCLPSQHWSRRGLFDGNETLWASWAVTAWERRFYFGGDTGYFAGFETIGEHLGPFDLAALPIGAYEPQAMMKPFHLDPEQAVQAGLDLGARRLMAMHFGTFDLSDEPLDEPPRRFLAAAREAELPDDTAWVFAIGETRPF